MQTIQTVGVDLEYGAVGLMVKKIMHRNNHVFYLILNVQIVMIYKYKVNVVPVPEFIKLTSSAVLISIETDDFHVEQKKGD